MTMISKKVFTSSNYRLFMLPAFTRAFLFKSSPSGELSYNTKKLPAGFLPQATASSNTLLNSRVHCIIIVFIHSIKLLISLTTLPLIILDNATNNDRIVTIIIIHCSFMFDSLLLYSAASFNSFRILSICTFVSLILLDIPSRLLDDTEPFL